MSAYGEVVAQDGARVTLYVPKADTPRITAQILAACAVQDLTVEDPPIEDVIEHVFATEAIV